jgi:hypothetical protein
MLKNLVTNFWLLSNIGLNDRIFLGISPKKLIHPLKEFGCLMDHGLISTIDFVIEFS